jgi:hypothetical protein
LPAVTWLAPASAAASIPTRIASRTGSSASPSITISNTASTSGGTSVCSTCPRSVGHSASLVDAGSAL